MQATSHGATACVVFTSQDKIICANCGDSRAILYTGGKVVPLSHDFKPERPSERARIEANQGVVKQFGFGPYRLYPGGLSLSRALGDRDFKLVSGVPELMCADLDEQVEFFCVACDGVFDVLSDTKVAEIIIQYRAEAQIQALQRAYWTADDPALISLGRFVLGFYAKCKQFLKQKYTRFAPSEQQMLLADALAARFLAQKVTETALRLGSTDNVTCVVGLLRWPGTARTST